MQAINRLMTNICSDNLQESKLFYTKLFQLEVQYDSDWFIHLVSIDQNLELGIIKRTHEIVPQDYQNAPQGFYLTFVVDDVDEIFKVAKAENFKTVSKPTDTSYGQRRLLLKDPSGALVDISSLIKD